MSVIDTLKHSEHTGENRCLPCTAVNVFVVVLVGLALGVVWLPVAGFVAVAVGALFVYFWGYVVPGTPSFAPPLVAAVGLGGVFGHGEDDTRQSESLDANVSPDVMLSTLLNADVLVEDEDGLFLTDDARGEWEETMATLRTASDEDVADAVASALPFEATVAPEFDGFSIDGPSMSVWLSRPQAIADVATLYTVVERGVDSMVALAATEPMRMFADVCPECGGPVEETTTRNCCGGTAGLHDSPEHDVLGCVDCGAVVYEFHEE
ncbi:hypothetical protein C440_10868 [Haloferax mucosum ATCC BAA-1512]|uniref:Uncharacterized protein n=1 Tax=Haloferax mucosum ATCC BAA-1512 TaxID=662479 RepID=M0IDI1_9EURY|nr:hypothetical protein [Haloferax mucosum]ELZ94117.1 hypothetical protein C440_10868 [Haloferax mucosum ATCC BAA-1512]